MGILSRMGRAATALSKYYYPFTWRNKPSIESPINEVHLNHIEDGINEMDNRILILAQDKADASDMANVFIDFDIDDTTGTMTFTRFDGTKKSRDTPMEKIILNCYLEDDNFVLVLADGTKQKVSLAKFIDTYTFTSSDTIRFSVNGKNISADIPDGKITLAKLEPTIMSTIRQYTLDAQTAQGVAEQAAGTAQGWAIGGTGFEDNNAKHYASKSQRYAVGGVEEGDTEDNAKYYCQQAQAAAEQATGAAGFDGTAATVSAIDTQGVAVRKASGTGHVTIENAAEHPILNLNLAGKSEQVSTTGAQLLDTSKLEITHNEVEFSMEENGGVLVTGNTLQNAANSAVVPVTLSPGAYYISGSTPIGESKIFVRIKLWHGDSSSVVSDASFSVDGTETKIECFIQLYQGLSDFKAVVYPMLNAGETALPWEPYTGGKPSPSPDYQQPIISTGTVTTGAQLLIPQITKVGVGVTATVTDDGKIRIKGTPSDDNNRDIYLLGNWNSAESYIPSGKYTLSCEHNGLLDTMYAISNASVIASTPSNVLTFAATDEKTLGAIMIHLKATAYDCTLAFMLNAGDTPKPWEPYTGGKPSPSPEYPQPLDVTVTGAQLLDIPSLSTKNYLGVTYSPQPDGTVIATGTSTGTSYIDLRIQEPLPLGDYYISGCPNGGGGDRYQLMTYTVNNGSYKVIGSDIGNGSKFTVTDDNPIAIRIVMRLSTSGPLTFKPMLNAGDTPLPWQPYQSCTATITLTEPLRGIGDYRDRIMCRDGVWGIERNIGHSKLTSDIVSSASGGVTTSNNVINNRYTTILCIALKNQIKKGLYSNSIITTGFCNVANPGRVDDWNRGTGGKDNIYTINSAGEIYISIPISSIGVTSDATRGEVIAAVKQYVTDHDVYVAFVLSTPTWEPLPSATQSALNALTTYTGTTHVTVTAGGPEPDVGLGYFGQPGDKVTVQDMCDSFAAPGFDDGGEVEEITSFQSFYDKFVSGMKIRDFFRNLKAGLKFVLHTGQLVNNGLCNEPGKYPLDAAYGRTLLEMIGNTENLPGGAADIVSAIVTQNSNLSHKANAADYALINLAGMNFLYDQNNNTVGFQWLFGANKEYGYAINISTANGGMQFYYLNNGIWMPSWNK